MTSDVTQKHMPPSVSQQTVPHIVQKPQPAPTVSVPQPTRSSARPVQPAQPSRTKSRQQARPKKKGQNWWLVSLAALFVGVMMICLALTGWLGLLYAGGDILPGVHAFGVDLGSKSPAQAEAALSESWAQGIVVQDGEREWRVDAAALGIWLDTAATADAAYEQGRSNPLKAMLGGVTVAPVLNLDLPTTQAMLLELAPQFEMPAINAGVQLVDGHVQATPPQAGRMVDVAATMARVQEDASDVLADGVLELVMISVPPTVVDSGPMVAQAAQLLANPLVITVFDPVSNDRLHWNVAPEEWSRWLVATSDSNSLTELALTLETIQLTSYLASREAEVGAGRYFKSDEAVNTIQTAIQNNRTDAVVRVYHRERQHTVRNGETFSSIAYDYGVPYPWIQAANPGVPDGLSVGQIVVIPSPDDLLPLPVVYGKRIVVSISQQRMWIYENDQLKWEWVISTGIASSPTAPGIFQIQSHEQNAYAANWNLWMPHFMGVYRPVPSSDFMNGFHGFPTRGGNQLLWTNSLGTPVTYGCILVADVNVAGLYEWAENGVVVEIQR